MWRFDPEAWREDSIFTGLHRGVSFWSDGEGTERVVSGTFSGYLYSLDAHTGQPDTTFSEGGRIDLTQGLGRPVERWAYAHPSPPMICRDVIVTGSAIIDMRVQNQRQPEITPPGDVRGYDVRTGELLWTFHAIPRVGEFGADTWQEGAWKEFGAVNVWSMMSADEELGYVYLPFGTPSNDFYGGDRPGDNLFGDSIVCLDARTDGENRLSCHRVSNVISEQDSNARSVTHGSRIPPARSGWLRLPPTPAHRLGKKDCPNCWAS